LSLQIQFQTLGLTDKPKQHQYRKKRKNMLTSQHSIELIV
jgi:hypothetical protein